MSGYDPAPVRSEAAGTSPGLRNASSAPVLSIVSFVLSAIAIFFVPILFGGAAIVLAGVAMARKQRYARVALVVAIAATILGTALGAIAVSELTQG